MDGGREQHRQPLASAAMQAGVETEKTGVDRWARAARRAVARHRRWVVALLAGGCAVAVVSVLSPPRPATTAVVVARRDIIAGSVLGADDLAVSEVEAGLAPPGAAADPAAFVGRVAATPLAAGEPVSDTRVIGSVAIAGYPAGSVALPVPAPTAVAALVAPGDHVDLYAASARPGGVAELVAADAVVVATPDAAATADQRSVVVAVPGSAAARIAQASATTQVTLALRGAPPSSTEPPAVGGPPPDTGGW